MQPENECYSCIIRQAEKLIKDIAAKNPEAAERAGEFFRNFDFANRDIDKTILTPPYIAMKFYDAFADITGIRDPYAEEKKRSTELALSMLPELEDMVKNSADPFRTAVLLAAGGNIIDYGVHPDLDLKKAGDIIRNVLDEQIIDENNIRELQRRFDKAEKIFYMLDNCGEAVVDRLLLEQCRDRVTIGVRGKPILNDVTRKEAKDSGIDFAPVVDTGCGIPGVILNEAPEDFKRAICDADLIISKGQGNFECLNESGLPIAFLLRAKCPVVAKLLGSPLGDLRVVL